LHLYLYGEWFGGVPVSFSCPPPKLFTLLTNDIQIAEAVIHVISLKSFYLRGLPVPDHQLCNLLHTDNASSIHNLEIFPASCLSLSLVSQNLFNLRSLELRAVDVDVSVDFTYIFLVS
jgi:hypothetical protein